MSPTPPLKLLQRTAGDDPLVLLVDDYDEYRRSLARVLRIEFGFEVLEAEDGLRGFGILEKRAQQQLRLPDLVVADERMPGITGTELLKVIGRRWPAIRRILLSGHTMGQQVVDAGYPVLDKTLGREVIFDEICRYARGT